MPAGPAATISGAGSITVSLCMIAWFLNGPTFWPFKGDPHVVQDLSPQPDRAQPTRPWATPHPPAWRAGSATAIRAWSTTTATWTAGSFRACSSSSFRNPTRSPPTREAGPGCLRSSPPTPTSRATHHPRPRRWLPSSTAPPARRSAPAPGSSTRSNKAAAGSL